MAEENNIPKVYNPAEVEKKWYACLCKVLVHGDIRHLERPSAPRGSCWQVHGDIRHLEKQYL